MNQNPFQSPQAVGTAAAFAGDRDKLRRIASDQRGIMICILVYIAAIIGQFLLPRPEGTMIATIVALGAVLAGVVFVFRLATKVYSTGTGIVLGLLTFVPLLGLIVLLTVNSKATRLLRAQGVSVGLLGARMPTG
jgi:hypothetical protein